MKKQIFNPDAFECFTKRAGKIDQINGVATHNSSCFAQTTIPVLLSKSIQSSLSPTLCSSTLEIAEYARHFKTENFAGSQFVIPRSRKSLSDQYVSALSAAARKKNFYSASRFPLF